MDYDDDYDNDVPTLDVINVSNKTVVEPNLQTYLLDQILIINTSIMIKTAKLSERLIHPTTIIQNYSIDSPLFHYFPITLSLHPAPPSSLSVLSPSLFIHHRSHPTQIPFFRKRRVRLRVVLDAGRAVFTAAFVARAARHCDTAVQVFRHDPPFCIDPGATRRP